MDSRRWIVIVGVACVSLLTVLAATVHSMPPAPADDGWIVEPIPNGALVYLSVTGGFGITGEGGGLSDIEEIAFREGWVRIKRTNFGTVIMPARRFHGVRIYPIKKDK